MYFFFKKKSTYKRPPSKRNLVATFMHLEVQNLPIYLRPANWTVKASLLITWQYLLQQFSLCIIISQNLKNQMTF